METDELLSIPGMRESLIEAEADVASGRTLSLEQALSDGRAEQTTRTGSQA
jgi:hypothetical protein